MLGVVPKLKKVVLSWNFWPYSVKRFLGHPAGPFTIFFWCPLIKWAIIFANLKDLTLPTYMISTRLQLVLMLTGLVWTRYSFVITPVNYNLAAVNFFMAATSGKMAIIHKKNENNK